MCQFKNKALLLLLQLLLYFIHFIILLCQKSKFCKSVVLFLIFLKKFCRHKMKLLLENVNKIPALFFYNDLTFLKYIFIYKSCRVNLEIKYKT